MKSKHYKEKEFWDKFEPVIQEAKSLWRQKSEKTYKKIGDAGPVIMGDGVQAMIIPKRCKNPRPVEIISSAEASHCQGNAHYEMHVQEIVDFLKSKGVDCWYSYGRMD